MDPSPRPQSDAIHIQDVVADLPGLRTALAAGRTSVLRYEPETRTVSTDGILDRLLGFPADSTRTLNEWTRLVHPDDLQSLLLLGVDDYLRRQAHRVRRSHQGRRL